MECLYLILVLLGISNSQTSAYKSSLTFVIDDTGSMDDEINQVKRDVEAIFDTVVYSKRSHIEDFALVTFNDPGVSFRTRTKDMRTFKNALSAIRVHGGGDCPENAMAGIELALRNSRDGSQLYVFTDASAKDYKEVEKVKDLSVKKGVQIVFVLTGICSTMDSADYRAYKTLASATRGQVFHMGKSDIGEILEYVKYTIKDRKHPIASKTYPPGYGHKFDVNVDGDTKELEITVSGVEPTVSVKDSAGTAMPVHDITRLPRVAVVSVPGVKPGVYKVEVGSTSETEVQVSGSTTIHFQHGFSVVKPTGITETTKQPVPKEKSYVSIKLETEGGDVELQSVQIQGLDGRVVAERPLELVNHAENFYVSTEPLSSPDHAFLIAIKGYDKESKTFITRVSLTQIEPQKLIGVTTLQKAPVISVNVDEIEAEYKESLLLKCGISGYPKPDVIWESDDPTAVLSHSDSVVELPYEYISVLSLTNVKKSSTYTCKAVNRLGEDFKRISVQMKHFLNLLDNDKDITIEYKSSGHLTCHVEASPPATITWYKKGRVLKTDARVSLSADGSLLTIDSMQPADAGNYLCEARNEFKRGFIRHKVAITGAEKPKINKNEYAVTALINSTAEINCELIRGQPAPSFTWYYSPSAGEDLSPRGFVKLDATEPMLTITNVELRHAGRYRCVAVNELGRDLHDIDFIVEYAPEQTEAVPPRLTASAGDIVSLPCPVAAAPPPDYRWRRVDHELPRRHTLFRDGTLRFTASLEDSGIYECLARNDHGEVPIKVKLEINDPVRIEPPKRSSLSVTVGQPLVLPCRADGSPAPTLRWLFHSSHVGSATKTYAPSDSSGSLHLKRAQPSHDGFYTCVASNAGGSKNITYTVTVLSAPFIKNKGQEFTAVAGDWALRVPCDVGGNPPPTVTWAKGSDLLALDSEWYGAEGNDLVLRIVDEAAAGLYTCHAENSLGADTHPFPVTVQPYPNYEVPDVTTWVEEGQSATVPCSVPHGSTDRLIWYKDRAILSDGELSFKRVSRRDDGFYSCRVSSPGGARSAHTRLRVGWKPRFLLNEDTDIPYDVGNFALLSCDASAQPEAEIHWFHEGVPLPVSEPTHEVEMTGPRDQGRYRCVVSNRFDTIQREYVISAQECVLDIKKDFDGFDPLMLTRYLDLKELDTIDGQLRITRGDSVTLVCPSGFNTIPERHIEVQCENDNQFSYRGRRYSYSELKCRQKINPKVKQIGGICANGASKMMGVGYELSDRFIEVYQACLDMTMRNATRTIYTKHEIGSSMSEVVPEYGVNLFDIRGSFDMDSMYDCSRQRLGVDVRDGCCLLRRQLVSPRDVAPALRSATDSSLNVAPQWGTCNSQNWEEVEGRIRGLARASRRPLRVFSGATGTLPGVTLGGAPVPQYFWKVVDDETLGTALAIVQVNVPGLKLRDATHYRICNDVCSETDWMRGKHWRSVDRGYTYCCRVEELEARLGLRGVFPTRRRLLASAGHLPESSALHLG